MEEKEEEERAEEGGLAKGGKWLSSFNTTMHDSASAFKCFILCPFLYLLNATMYNHTEERHTVQTHFPLGLSKMYGLCGNWVSLIRNGANTAESYSVDIFTHCHPTLTRTSSNVCRPADTHAYTARVRAHTKTHAFPHHCDSSSPVEWAVPSYLPYLLHPPIYYWCNGALYLNAALPLTTTSAQREPGQWLRAPTGAALGRVSEEMDEW